MVSSLPPERARFLSLAELSVFYGLVFAAIWIGQRLPHRPSLWFGAAALFLVAGLSNRRHGDGREKIGLAAAHFIPCLKLTAAAGAGPVAVLLVLALQEPLPPLPKIIFGVLGYPFWALAQQYALQSFSANRLRDALGERPWTVALVNGALFSLVHFPNPVLVAVCFVGGVVFTRIFLKTPHLVPIALAHAAVGFLLSVVLQGQYNGMMVGPSYWKWSGVPGPHP